MQLKQILPLFLILFFIGCTHPVKETALDKNIEQNYFPEEDAAEIFKQAKDYYQNEQFKLAIIGYQKAAEKGLAVAQNNLGFMFLAGKGIAQDSAQAMIWFKKAAEQNLPDAQYNIARIYYLSEKQDLVQAKQWYKKAALQNHIDAQYYLGELYYQAEQFDDAKPWYQKAALQDSAKAQYKLGIIYYRKKQFVQVEKWFRHAAKQNYAPAQNGLGKLHYDGTFKQHFKEAVFWFRKAAEQGLAEAQNNLAMSYYEGKGIEKDVVLAYMWVSLAANQGHKDSIEGRDILTNELSVKQIMQGERLLSEKQMQYKVVDDDITKG